MIRNYAVKNGFVLNEFFTGHGIGKYVHMPPVVYHHCNDYPYIMKPGNVFTIEPIIQMKTG